MKDEGNGDVFEDEQKVEKIKSVGNPANTCKIRSTLRLREVGMMMKQY